MSRSDPQLKIRLEPEVKQWLDNKAKEMRLTRTWLLNNLAKEEMKREQKQADQK